MARHIRLHVLQTMIKTGLVPVFHTADLEIAKHVALACAEGGCLLLEFTNRGDHAWEVFSGLERFLARECPDMMLGAGSIIDPATAALYINCGAAFIVGPVLNGEVAKVCNRRKIAYCPGCGSASEISAAEELGVEIVKIFPGKEVGGPTFVKMIRGPCPWTAIMPTGGVEPTEESLRAWFEAGVACVGMGSNLITSALLQKGDYGALREKVRDVLGIIAKVREGKNHVAH